MVKGERLGRGLGMRLGLGLGVRLGFALGVRLGFCLGVPTEIDSFLRGFCNYIVCRNLPEMILFLQ